MGGYELRWKTVTYFVENMVTGNIKIGYANDVLNRVPMIGSYIGAPVRLLGYVMGGKTKEAELHERFTASRLPSKRADNSPSEWFTPSPELLQFIKEETTLGELKGIRRDKRVALLPDIYERAELYGYLNDQTLSQVVEAALAKYLDEVQPAPPRVYDTFTIDIPAAAPAHQEAA